MFTGLVERTAIVRSVEVRGRGLWVSVGRPASTWHTRAGDSIAVSGACLTLVESASRPVDDPRTTADAALDELTFDLSAETLERTWFASLKPGLHVNLERALCLGERLDGHLVSGHVDGQARVVAIEEAGDGGRVLHFELEAGLERYLIEKGSIALDGVSLTVVRPAGRTFVVAAIPHTLENTTLGGLVVGQSLNVEVDMIAKWIERLLPR